MRGRVWGIAIGAACIATGTGGCAINGSGLIRTDYYTNGTEWAIRMRMFGAHLVTYPEDAGLRLGWTDRTYYFAPDVRTGGVPGFDEMREASVLWKTDETPPEISNIFGWVAQDVGVRVDTGEIGVSVGIGASSRAVTRVPAEGDLLILIEHGPDGHRRLYVQRLDDERGRTGGGEG